MISVRKSSPLIAMKFISILVHRESISSTGITLFALGSEVEASVARAFGLCFLIVGPELA